MGTTEGQLRISKALENEIAQENSYEVIRAKLHAAAGLQPDVRMASNWDSPLQPVNTARFSRDDDPQQREQRARVEQGRFVSAERTEQTTFSKTVDMPYGRKMTFSGASELEVERQIASAYRFLQPTEEQRETQSWSNSVKEFLSSAAGAEWPGQEANKNILALILQANYADKGSDRVGSIGQAFAQMKASGLVLAPGASPNEAQSKAIFAVRSIERVLLAHRDKAAT